MTISVTHPTDRPNFTIVHLDSERAVAFSYSTPIGVLAPDVTGTSEWICRENPAAQTTGKHLNHLNPDRSARLAAEDFETLLAEVTR